MSKIYLNKNNYSIIEPGERPIKLNKYYIKLNLYIIL